jgi:diguanylate cyclase (GGDEF)-like protein/putative nucleotidyltransferase with HDIG domain
MRRTVSPSRTHWSPRALALGTLAAAVTLTVAVAMLVAPEAVWSAALGRWAQSLAEGAGAVACALTARNLRGRERWCWALFATGLGIWSLTDLAVGVAVATGNPPTPPSPFDVPWLLFYAPMLAGLLVLYGRIRPEPNWQGVLDAGLVAGGVGLIAWILVLEPVSHTASGGALGTAVNLCYPVLDLVSLGALGWVIARHAGAAPAWLWWLASAFGASLVADISYLAAYAHDLPVAAALAAAGYTAGGWLWVRAASLRGTGPALPPGRTAAPPLWGEAVPLVCGLAVLGLLVGDGGPLEAIGALIVGLVGVRVVLAYRANRRLVEERRVQGHELEMLVAEQGALRRVAEAVATQTAPTEVFAQVAREVTTLFGSDAGMVWRFEGGEAEAVGSHGDDAAPPGTRIALTGDGAAPTVAQTGRSASASYEAGRHGEGAVRHGIASPVAVGGRPWGCVHIATTLVGGGRPFDTATEQRLERFAELVGLALANADSRRALQERAATDPLTGLANRRHFQERMFEEWDRARRQGHDLALVLIDLDHFKRVNDTYGHPAGDRVLAELAGRLRSAIRAHDVLGRIGGEEFAWLLPGATEQDAVSAAERARALVRDTAFAGVGALTASFGVCHSDDATGPSELQQLADDALYTAKHLGRDRVCTEADASLRGSATMADRVLEERQQSIRGVVGLARAVDAKDPLTRRHSGRVADLAVQLATALGWEAGDCAALRDAGLMHDVGKIAVPDAVLLKPGRLTPDEYELVKTHAVVGARIVADVLTPEQVRWVRGHHERWDGDGYPDGIAGEAIAEGARILALADAVDVMLTPRPYAPGRGLDETLAEVERCSGTQFDPGVVAAFRRLVEVGALSGPTALPQPA